MLKKINALLNIFMGCLLGVYMGRILVTYMDYRKNPGIYEMGSAPWYSGIEIEGIALAILLAVCLVIKAVIRRESK